MLQFNTIVCTASTKLTSRLWWRLSIPLTTNAAVIPESASKLKKVTKNIKTISPEQRTNFDELKTKLSNFLRMRSVVTINVQKATNVEELMEMTKSTLLSPQDIATIKEIIDTWIINNGAVQSTGSSKSFSNTESIDTSDIFFDLDSMYGTLSTSGIIREISKLVENKKRDVPVLKYLFESIIKYNDVLNPGQCSNLMFSMSRLSFSDERLLNKICIDLQRYQYSTNFSTNLKLSSIIKSMASVRYKNNEFLKKVCNNIKDSAPLCNSGQLINILTSLAILGYESEVVNNIIEKYLPYITVDKIEIVKYLNFVWSLIIFNKANIEHVRSVLDGTFIHRLKVLGQCYESHILKLLNINAYAKYVLKDYSGPFLSDSVMPITRIQSKQKQLYIKVLEATLKNIAPSPSHFRMNVNTNMGFLLDAELYLDSNCRPVCVNEITDDYKKLAIMIFDYYDLCLGSLEPCGLNKFYTRLLTDCKYDVLNIPYHHFGIEDKMEKRVMYLKDQLWNKYKNKLFKNAEQ